MIFRYDLQCLRGYAILFVYLYHKYKNIFKGGFLAVDIFFILSGYFSAYSLIEIMGKRLTLTDYYCKRTMRIKPVSDIVLLLIYIISKNIYILWKRCKEIISSVFYFANYYFYFQSVDYLEQSNSIGISPLLHYWYLSVEVQFYVLSSISFRFFFSKLPSLCSSVLFIVINYIYVLFLNINNSKFVYFSFGVRLIEYYFGFLLSTYNFPNLNITNRLYFDIFIIVLWIISMKLCSLVVYPNYFIILPLLFSLIIILYSKNNNSYILSIKIFQYMGKISYSFYIIHFPLIIIYKTISLIQIVILSLVLYYVIENPFSKYKLSNITVVLYFVMSILLFVELYKKSKNKIILNTKFNCIGPVSYKNPVYFIGCILNKSKIINIKDYILFLGDSHLRQWIPSIYSLINTINKPMLFIYFWIYQYNRFGKIGSYFNKFYYPSFIIQCFSLNFNMSAMNYIIYKDFVLNISSKVEKYIILQDNPRLSFNPNLYYNTKSTHLYSTNNINCTFGMDKIFNHNHLFYIYNNYMCKNNICPFYYQNKKLYSDNNHITSCMIDLIKENVIKEIRKILHIQNTFKQYNHKISYCIFAFRIPI